MKAFIKNFLILTFSGLCLFITALSIYIPYSLPKKNGLIKAKGLKDKVQIYFDKKGRPHIYANNTHDLLFAQGYLTAQDRLFQLDLSRRAAKGELAEILGQSGLIRDKFVRTIGLNESAKQELKNLPKETHELLEAYSEGITEYINSNYNHLPIEFVVLNYKPKAWEAIDSIILTKQFAEIIDTSWQIDLMRHKIYTKLPTRKADDLFEQTFPGNPIINYNPKKYLVFNNYLLNKPTISERWQNLKKKIDLKKNLDSPYFKIKKKIIEAADFLRNGSDRWEGFNWGSNCWVIGTVKNQSPILANDPHLELSTPGIWYPIHLTNRNGDEDLLGLSIPGIPGILVGHNKNIAWGITSLSADVQDVFIGNFKNSKSLLYRSGDKWKRAKVVKSTIKIKNQSKPYIHKTIITSCGPILDKNRGKALAVKWSTIEVEKCNTIEAIWKLGISKNWEDFREALRFYSGPTLSFHYTDLEGNIGYQAAGIIPDRVSDSGSLPIAGFDSKEYWLGYIPFDELPNSYNPSIGYIISANNKVVSSEYKHDLGNNFLSPFRAVRISSILTGKNNINLKKNKLIQKDQYSWVANYLTIQILEAYYNSKMVNRDLLPIIQLLSKWDFKIDANSPQAFIFEKTYENLIRKILTDKLGSRLTKEYLKEWRASSLALIRILIDGDRFWLPRGVENYESLLLISLSDAADEIKSITKNDNPKSWIWGKYHTLTLEHPFSKALPILSPIANVGPLPLGGDRDTIAAFGINDNLKAIWGPSARVVIDLNDLDNAHFQLPLGVSAQLGSKHYYDQNKDWYENSGSPFVYKYKSVIKDSESLLVLDPK